MALMFYSELDDPADWRRAMARHHPDLDFRVWPEIGDPAQIRYALVWRPKPGLLASLPNLELILNTGAGVDGVLSDPAFPRQVPLVRMVDRSLTEGMAEYVCWQVLEWHRGGRYYRRQAASRQWHQRDERLARDCRVGILGLGELGREAAQRLADLRYDVAGWSRTPKQIDRIACYTGPGQLPDFLARTECLVCLLPLTEDTRGLLDRNLFARLPKGAHLINAGRGGHLVEADLIPALDTGQIGSAALDVFETEPLPAEHPFWGRPEITITPHVAALTLPDSAAETVARSLAKHLAGQPLDNLVDPDAGY